MDVPQTLVLSHTSTKRPSLLSRRGPVVFCSHTAFVMYIPSPAMYISLVLEGAKAGSRFTLANETTFDICAFWMVNRVMWLLCLKMPCIEIYHYGLKAWKPTASAHWALAVKDNFRLLQTIWVVFASFLPLVSCCVEQKDVNLEHRSNPSSYFQNFPNWKSFISVYFKKNNNCVSSVWGCFVASQSIHF